MAMMMATMTVTGTATTSAAATVTVRAKATTIRKISQSYRAWQVPALGSKGAAIRLFLFKLTATMTAMMIGAATAIVTATATTNISQ